MKIIHKHEHILYLTQIQVTKLNELKVGYFHLSAANL